MRISQIAIVVAGLALAAGAWLVLFGHGASIDSSLNEDGDVVVPVVRAADLAGQATRRDRDVRADAASLGAITGTVRRGGKPVAAHVLVFEVSRAVRGEPLGWAESRQAIVIPPEDAAAIAPIARADASPDGQFTVAVAAPGAYAVVARDAEGRSGHARASVDVAGERADVSIELTDGGETLAGRAVRADGSPFRGFVSASAASTGFDVFEAIAGRATATDEEGRFLLAALPPGPCVVEAYVPGRFRATSRTVVLPRHGEFRFVVDPGVREAAGRVVADKDGQAVAGAQVAVSSWSTPGLTAFTARAVTEGDGRFKVLVPPTSAEWSVR